MDLFRRPETLEPFLLSCEADARGRTGLESKPYPSANWLRHLLPELQNIKAADFVSEGLRGPAIGEAIRTRRWQVIAEYKRSHPIDRESL